MRAQGRWGVPGARAGGRAGLTVPIVATHGCVWEVLEAERQLLDHVLVVVRGIDVDRLGHDARLRQQLDALNRGHLERHDARLARGGAVLPPAAAGGWVREGAVSDICSPN